MTKVRIGGFLILLIGVVAGYFVYATERGDHPLNFKLGLDLAGGTELIYRADVSLIAVEDVPSAMAALRDVIERRVNAFGVSEPRVVASRKSSVADMSGSLREERLLVELPGVTDVDEAIALIGRTPLLEFKLLNDNSVVPDKESEERQPEQSTENALSFTDTGLTGRFLKSASLEFGGVTGSPTRNASVAIEFTEEGSHLFQMITRENRGNILAIFLDGHPLSLPVIQDEISEGKAVITGDFTPEEARDLARSLNLGALPVPVELIATQSVGASLGERAVQAGVKAGIVGFIAVAVFLILWYRVRGIVAVVSLGMYVIFMLALFKIIPVTLTAAGVAGFILSIGMAVDANILIFERITEESSGGGSPGHPVPPRDAIIGGFRRAWLSIRDANTSSIIMAVILFWFGTALVKGFALTFGIGVLTSMITAIVVSRTFLLAITKESRCPNEGV